MGEDVSYAPPMPPIEITTHIDSEDLLDHIIESLGSDAELIEFIMRIDRACESYDFSLCLIRSLLKNMMKDFDDEQSIYIRKLMENSTTSNPRISLLLENAENCSDATVLLLRLLDFIEANCT